MNEVYLHECMIELLQVMHPHVLSKFMSIINYARNIKWRSTCCVDLVNDSACSVHMKMKSCQYRGYNKRKNVKKIEARRPMDVDFTNSCLRLKFSFFIYFISASSSIVYACPYKEM